MEGHTVETKAVARYIRISPRKARLVIDTIRGRDLDEAEQILDFSDRAAARVVSKVLRSAAANAENNNGLSPETLFVSKAFVDEGPTLKRFRPRAMGRATRINKRTCHITVILDEREPDKVKPKRRRIRQAAAAARGAVTRSRAGKAAEEEEPEAPAEEQDVLEMESGGMEADETAAGGGDEVVDLPEERDSTGEAGEAGEADDVEEADGEGEAAPEAGEEPSEEKSEE